MAGPYRTPDSTLDDADQPDSAPELGRLRSSHDRGVAGVVAVALGRRSAVDVHENGLVIWDAIGRRSEVAFRDVDAVHYESDGLLRDACRLTLVTFAGERVCVPALAGVVDAVDCAVTMPIVAEVKAAMAEGRRLDFGPLVLTLDGIVLAGVALPWSELAYVAAEPNAFVFYAREPRGRFGWVGLSDIPHPRALVEALGMRTKVVMRGLRLR